MSLPINTTLIRGGLCVFVLQNLWSFATKQVKVALTSAGPAVHTTLWPPRSSNFVATCAATNKDYVCHPFQDSPKIYFIPPLFFNLNQKVSHLDGRRYWLIWFDLVNQLNCHHHWAERAIVVQARLCAAKTRRI